MVWAAKRKLSKAEKAALKRLEREEEILAKAPEDLTDSEWKWLRNVMNKIHRENPQGHKKETRYDDWMHRIARQAPRKKASTIERLGRTEDASERATTFLC